jgi:hypothetical protein
MNSLLLASLLVVSVPQASEPPGFVKFAGKAFVGVSHAIDYGSTMFWVGEKLLYEANDVLSPFANRPITFGLIKSSVAVAQIWILDRFENSWWSQITAWAIGGVNSYVIWRNNREADRARHATNK